MGDPHPSLSLTTRIPGMVALNGRYIVLLICTVMLLANAKSDAEHHVNNQHGFDLPSGFSTKWISRALSAPWDSADAQELHPEAKPATHDKHVKAQNEPHSREALSVLFSSKEFQPLLASPPNKFIVRCAHKNKCLDKTPVARTNCLVKCARKNRDTSTKNKKKLQKQAKIDTWKSQQMLQELMAERSEITQRHNDDVSAAKAEVNAEAVARQQMKQASSDLVSAEKDLKDSASALVELKELTKDDANLKSKQTERSEKGLADELLNGNTSVEQLVDEDMADEEEEEEEEMEQEELDDLTPTSELRQVDEEPVSRKAVSSLHADDKNKEHTDKELAEPVRKAEQQKQQNQTNQKLQDQKLQKQQRQQQRLEREAEADNAAWAKELEEEDLRAAEEWGDDLDLEDLTPTSELQGEDEAYEQDETFAQGDKPAPRKSDPRPTEADESADVKFANKDGSEDLKRWMALKRAQTLHRSKRHRSKRMFVLQPKTLRRLMLFGIIMCLSVLCLAAIWGARYKQRQALKNAYEEIQSGNHGSQDVVMSTVTPQTCPLSSNQV